MNVKRNLFSQLIAISLISGHTIDFVYHPLVQAGQDLILIYGAITWKAPISVIIMTRPDSHLILS